MTAAILMVVKNAKPRERLLRQALDSITNQTISCACVIQDGASTDGTLDILREYDNLDIESVPDSCSEEALYRGLERCKAGIVGTCMSDEVLPPYAAALAVKLLQDQPDDVVAIYGQQVNLDQYGNVRGVYKPPPFTLANYAQQRCIPPFATAWFKRDGLMAAGVGSHEWRHGIGEYELWIRLAGVGKIVAMSALLAGYTIIEGETFTGTPERYEAQLEARCACMDHLFAQNPALARSGIKPCHARAGNWLWAAAVCHVMGKDDLCRRYADLCNAACPDYQPLLEWQASLREE